MKTKNSTKQRFYSDTLTDGRIVVRDQWGRFSSRTTAKAAGVKVRKRG